MSKIEEKINQLEQNVDWFYSEKFNLSEASDKYQESKDLAKSIEEDLNNLKNKIEIIK